MAGGFPVLEITIKLDVEDVEVLRQLTGAPAALDGPGSSTDDEAARFVQGYVEALLAAARAAPDPPPGPAAVS